MQARPGTWTRQTSRACPIEAAGRCQESMCGLGGGDHPSANQGVRVVPDHSQHPNGAEPPI
jgi:hypothetical protein